MVESLKFAFLVEQKKQIKQYDTEIIMNHRIKNLKGIKKFVKARKQCGTNLNGLFAFYFFSILRCLQIHKPQSNRWDFHNIFFFLLKWNNLDTGIGSSMIYEFEYRTLKNKLFCVSFFY